MNKEVRKLVENLEAARISRRSFVRRALALGLSMPTISALLSACAPSATPTVAPGATPTPTKVPVPSPTPKKGETLVVAAPGTPLTLDTDMQPSPENEWLTGNVYGDAFRYKLIYPPEIAPFGTCDMLAPYDQGVYGVFLESWEVSPDKKDITFHFKKGIKSPWGNELTAESYVWSMKRGLEFVKICVSYMFNICGIEDVDQQVEVVDDYTIVFHLPFASEVFFKARAMCHYSFVADSEEIKKHATPDDPWGAEWLTTHTAGFGPYHVESIVPDEEMVLVANPYWQNPLYFDKIIWKAVPDSATRWALLKAGEVDLAKGLSFREFASAEADPGLQVVRTRSNKIPFIGMSFSHPPLDNVLVRQALAYATPYEEIAEKVYLGHYEQIRSVVPVVVPNQYPEYWVYHYDLDKARELLAEAGYADGFEVEMAYCIGEEAMEEVAILTKSAWDKIGVIATLTPEAPAIYHEEKLKSPTAHQTFADNAQWPYVSDNIYALSAYMSSRDVYGTQNSVNYDNPIVNENCRKGWQLPSGPEREELAREAIEQASHDVVWIHLGDPGWVVGAKKDLKGFAFHPDQSVRFEHLYREA